MKTALISDIHGNYPALVAVLDEIQKMNCQRIISLGDIAGYYCMINECIELCREKRILNVLGNHDHYLISGNKCPRSFSANACLDYQQTIIVKANLTWLQDSLSMYRKDHCWFVHGGWHDYLDEYISIFDFEHLPDSTVNIFASGHSHIQSFQNFNNIVYVNPGSVGQPRDGDRRAAFAVINNSREVSLHRVDYDIDSIANAMRRAGFEERYFSGLYTGTKIQSYSYGI